MDLSCDSPVCRRSRSSLPPSPEPSTCAEGLPGVANGNICCAEECGQCGGDGCSNVPGTEGDSECCTGAIEEAGVICGEGGAVAPCIMSSPAPAVTPTTPLPVSSPTPPPSEAPETPRPTPPPDAPTPAPVPETPAPTAGATADVGMPTAAPETPPPSATEPPSASGDSAPAPTISPSGTPAPEAAPGMSRNV